MPYCCGYSLNHWGGHGFFEAVVPRRILCSLIAVLVVGLLVLGHFVMVRKEHGGSVEYGGRQKCTRS
eukprot:scaffold21278_cov62-Cyclotella_meneghiniana.AAC.1